MDKTARRRERNMPAFDELSWDWHGMARDVQWLQLVNVDIKDGR